jgi:DNA-binding NarL/FixJ family response regulator
MHHPCWSGGATTSFATVTISVLIAEDHPVVRKGLRATLADEPDLAVVAEARDGAEAIALYREHRPTVVLMDLRMPGMTGIEATRAITAEDSRARIVVLTTYQGDADIYGALEAGACGYLIKDMPSEDIVSAIRTAAAGQRVLPNDVARRLAEYTPRHDLTEREHEVLRLLAKGLRNRDIAVAIGRTEGTVKIHVMNLMRKLDVVDRTEAVTVALQRGIIHLDD